MKYEVKRVTPEFRAIAYTMLVVQVGLLLALYYSEISVRLFFYGYATLWLISLIVSHQQSEMVDESMVNI